MILRKHLFVRIKTGTEMFEILVGLFFFSFYLWILHGYTFFYPLFFYKKNSFTIQMNRFYFLEEQTVDYDEHEQVTAV